LPTPLIAIGCFGERRNQVRDIINAEVTNKKNSLVYWIMGRRGSFSNYHWDAD